MKKIWLKSENIISKYQNGSYRGINIGIRAVEPSKIIALCIDYDMVKNDFRMRKLKENVRINGWHDPRPITLGLTQIPTGEYAVQPGGNHRAVLSNELGLKEISANVYRIYPIATFPHSILDVAQKLREEKDTISAYLKINFDSNSDETLEKVNRLDEIDLETDQLYYNYVKDNNLI